MSEPTEEDLKAARAAAEALCVGLPLRIRGSLTLDIYAVILAKRAQAREAAEAKLHDADRQYLLLEKERDEARAAVASLEADVPAYQADFVRAEAAEARLREMQETHERNDVAFDSMDKCYQAAAAIARRLEGEVRDLRTALETSHVGYHIGPVTRMEAADAGCRVCALLARTETP